MKEIAAPAGDSGDRARGPVELVCWAVLLENLRRRDGYVLLLLMTIFACGAIMIRLLGTSSDATAAFALNLGLTMAFAFAKLFTLLTAVRQHPGELEARTLYPLLAKPLGRGQYLTGKMAASFITGLIATFGLLPIAWLAAPSVEGTSGLLLLQSLVLHFAALGLIAVLGVSLSLVLPKAVNLVLLALLITQGGTLLGYIRARATAGEGWAQAAQWIAAYIPDFSRLDLVGAYTDAAAPLALGPLAVRLLYTLLAAAAVAVLAHELFRRQPLN